MNNTQETIGEAINIKIPYSETSYGTIFVQCIKKPGQTDAEFLEDARAGDIDPIGDEYDPEWKQEGSDQLVISMEEIETWG